MVKFLFTETDSGQETAAATNTQHDNQTVSAHSGQEDTAPSAIPATRKGRKRNVTGVETAFKEGDKLLAPDGTEWVVEPCQTFQAGKKAQQNVFKDKPGPTPFAKRYIADDEAASAWRLLIDETILKHIKKCTEAEACKQLKCDEWLVSLEELNAVVAIMYVRGASGMKGLELDSLWSKFGVPFIKDVMSRNRFREILRYLRFDEKSTRSERLKNDKFALVSFVWERFVTNSQTCYVPGPYLCVDEQLFPTKTRCRFLQFILDEAV